jgi:hypothetical protein
MANEEINKEQKLWAMVVGQETREEYIENRASIVMKYPLAMSLFSVNLTIARVILPLALLDS